MYFKTIQRCSAARPTAADTAADTAARPTAADSTEEDSDEVILFFLI